MYNNVKVYTLLLLAQTIVPTYIQFDLITLFQIDFAC